MCRSLTYIGGPGMVGGCWGVIHGGGGSVEYQQVLWILETFSNPFAILVAGWWIKRELERIH